MVYYSALRLHGSDFREIYTSIDLLFALKKHNKHFYISVQKILKYTLHLYFSPEESKHP